MNRTKTSTLQITTPEGITFSLNLAGPVTRFLAWVVDLFCIWGLTMITGPLIALLGLISFDLASSLTILSYFIIQIGYGIVLEWFWRGQTLGKRLLKLRIMDVQGLHLQFSQIVIRNLLRAVDSLPIFYFVGGVSCLISHRAQRLGDIAANTIVVRSAPIAEPNISQLLSGKYNSLRDYPHLTARLRQRTSPQAADIALQSLLRRDQFDPLARLDLFKQIASHFKRVVDFPQEATDGITDEQYVRNIVDVLFRTRTGTKPE